MIVGLTEKYNHIKENYKPKEEYSLLLLDQTPSLSCLIFRKIKITSKKESSICEAYVETTKASDLEEFIKKLKPYIEKRV